MISYIGNTNGDAEKPYKLVEQFGLTVEDTITIFSDVVWNHDQRIRPSSKTFLRWMDVTISLIRGNQEEQNRIRTRLCTAQRKR